MIGSFLYNATLLCWWTPVCTRVGLLPCALCLLPGELMHSSTLWGGSQDAQGSNAQ